MVSVATLIRTCCPPVLSSAISQEEADELAAGFKVLADGTRLRLLSLIAAQPGDEACVCDLTEPLGLSQPTVSHHVKVLHDAGLLHRERRGQFVYYRVEPQRLEVLRAALSTR